MHCQKGGSNPFCQWFCAEWALNVKDIHKICEKYLWNMWYVSQKSTLFFKIYENLFNLRQWNFFSFFLNFPKKFGSNTYPRCIFHKIWPTTALIDPFRVDTMLDGHFGLRNQLVELRIICEIKLKKLIRFQLFNQFESGICKLIGSVEENFVQTKKSSFFCKLKNLHFFFSNQKISILFFQAI